MFCHTVIYVCIAVVQISVNILLPWLGLCWLVGTVFMEASYYFNFLKTAFNTHKKTGRASPCWPAAQGLLTAHTLL